MISLNVILNQKKSSKWISKICKNMNRLNDLIDDDSALGEGFCIGHSYFYTQLKIFKNGMMVLYNMKLDLF